MTVVACRDAGFPKRYQRGSLVVVWVLFQLSTKIAWHFKLPSRSKAFGSHHLIVRFTDFLVHKSLFTKGFWLAVAEIALRWRDSRNSQRGPCASDTKLDSLKPYSTLLNRGVHADKFHCKMRNRGHLRGHSGARTHEIPWREWQVDTNQI